MISFEWLSLFEFIEICLFKIMVRGTWLVNGGKRTECDIEKLIQKKRQLLETYYLYTWWDFCNTDGNLELKQQQKLICSNFLWIWENNIGLLKGKLRKIQYPLPRARLLQIAQKSIRHTSNTATPRTVPLKGNPRNWATTNCTRNGIYSAWWIWCIPLIHPVL